METPVSFNLAGARVTITNRNKGRMKIQFKLSKEQAEGYKSFQSIIKPPEMSEEQFMLQVFFAGCNGLTREVQALAHAEREKQLAEEAKNAQPESELEQQPVPETQDDSQ